MSSNLLYGQSKKKYKLREAQGAKKWRKLEIDANKRMINEAKEVLQLNSQR